jgi:hypothetical protein
MFPPGFWQRKSFQRYGMNFTASLGRGMRGEGKKLTASAALPGY